MTETASEPTILFYCRDCQRVVLDPKKKSDQYLYQCPHCKSDRVAFGTKQAICEFFHIKDSMLKKMLDNPEPK